MSNDWSFLDNGAMHIVSAFRHDPMTKTSIATVGSMTEALFRHRMLYVETDWTDGKMYAVTGTRVLIGPPVADLPVKAADAINEGCEILRLNEQDRYAKMVEYGYAIMPDTKPPHPVEFAKDEKSVRTYLMKP